MDVWFSALLSQFPWIVQGTSTRTWGSLRYPNKDEAEDLFASKRADFLSSLALDPARLVVSGNCHGKKIAVVGVDTLGRVDGVDGLVTDASGISLGIKSADCLPIFFVDTTGKRIAIAHAGWKGVMKGVAGETVEAMKRLGSDAADLFVAIGPSIRSCHYQVHPERQAEMLANTPHILPMDFKNGFVDLQGIVVRQLVASGVHADRIENTAPCTACHPELFSSYFLSKNPQQGMLSVIAMK